MSTDADDRADLAAAWDGAEGEPLHRLTGLAPPGWHAWRAGTSIAVLPALVPSAPLEVRRRYLARARANTSGACPLCSAVADLPTRTANGALRRANVPHAVGCPATFTDADRRWIDRRAGGTGDPFAEPSDPSDGGPDDAPRGGAA